MSDHDHVTDTAVSGRAWESFCDDLKAAGQLIVDHSTDELDRIEGFRYLSRLTRGGLSSFIEDSRVGFPVLSALPDLVKIGCDNPDSFYQRANISPDHRYRLTGRRGTVSYLSIGAYSGGYGAGAATPGRQGFLDDSRPNTERELGIILSVDQPELGEGERWLEMSSETTILIVRQFYLDRHRERPAELRLECLDPPGSTPPAFSATDLVNGLAMSALFVHGCAERFIGWVEDDFVHRPNTLAELPAGDRAGGWADPNQIFRHGYWALGPDESLVIEFMPPDCFYWNFQLNNLWEESLDYRFERITVNKHTASYQPDGSVRITVAHTDDGYDNWIDTGGRRHGTMGLRWNQAVLDVEPSVQVMSTNS